MIFVNGQLVALVVAVVLAPSDNFSTFRFRVMAFFVAFGPKNGHFWHVSPVEGSTLSFGPNLKLGRIVRITKKKTNYEYAGGPGPNYGETAVFAFCRKAEKNGQKSVFPYINTPQKARPC